MDIEKLINDLIEARGMSLTELTAQLGYQSKTSLVRIMKNQASQRAMDTFAKKVNANLALSSEERERLDEVLDYMRWRDDYASSREMLKFLRGETSEDADVWLEEIGSQGRMLFSQRYLNATEIRITMLNSQYVPIFQYLRRLVKERDATIEHYLRMRRDSTHVIHAISVLIPMIYERGYKGYSYRKSDGYAGQGMLSADVMVVQYRAADGAAREDMIVFDRADHGFVQTSAQTGGFVRMLGIRQENFESIKRTYFENGGLENYIQYSESYAQLEYNRAIYKIKPDIGIDWIPEDILYDALMEGSIPGIREQTEFVEKMERIYRERVRNTYEKRRVARTIMKRSAMVRFARTGRTTDHFWGMRSFRPDERLRILKKLLEQVESNPYFDIYFLKDNDFLRDVEIAYYENAGILMLDSATSYALEENHCDVMIVHNEFMRMFKEYFERSLLAEHVTSTGETIAFLNELIKIVMNDV